MSCEHSHEHVAVHGRCAACGQVLAYTGPLDLDPDGAGADFLAPPFVPDRDSRCRIGGTHQPDYVDGSCAVCPTQIDAFRDPSSDQLRWFETPY